MFPPFAERGSGPPLISNYTLSLSGRPPVPDRRVVSFGTTVFVLETQAIVESALLAVQVDHFQQVRGPLDLVGRDFRVLAALAVGRAAISQYPDRPVVIVGEIEAAIGLRLVP